MKLATVALVGLFVLPLLAACNSSKNRAANCVLWSGNAYAISQLRDIGKTEREASEMWMDMVKHMSPGVAWRVRQEIAWVYANPAVTQNQVELERHKACMAESWPVFKAP